MSEKKKCDLGEFNIDVILLNNGKYDVYISHSGSSGSHYENIIADDIGRLVADEVECFAEVVEA